MSNDELFIKIGTSLNINKEELQRQVNAINNQIELVLSPTIGKLDSKQIENVRNQIQDALKDINVSFNTSVNKNKDSVVENYDKSSADIAGQEQITNKAKEQQTIFKKILEIKNEDNIVVEKQISQYNKLGHLVTSIYKMQKGENGSDGKLKKTSTIDLADGLKVQKEVESVQKRINVQISEQTRKINESNLREAEAVELKSKYENIGGNLSNDKNVLAKQLEDLKFINKETQTTLTLNKQINQIREEQERYLDKAVSDGFVENDDAEARKLQYKKIADDSTLSLKEQKAQMQDIAKSENKRLDNLYKIDSQLKLIQERINNNDILSAKQKGKYQDILNNKASVFNNTKNTASDSEIQQQTADLNSLNAALSATERNTKSFKEKFEGAFAKFGQWLSIAAIFKTVQVAMKNMVSSVVKLDGALTELRKVTDLTESGLKNVTTEAFNLGRQVGRTGIEVVNAMSVWARAGKDVPTAEYLAKYTLMFTNIADGINDVTEASSALISIMSGFNMDDSSVESIINSINAISNTQPIDASNITEALKVVSSVSNQAGNSLEETEGMITGIFKTLRDSSKSATGLKFSPLYIEICIRRQI